MRLGNFLKQTGGTPLTGRSVRFKLLVRDKQGNRLYREVEALILPMSEAERIKALQECQTWLQEEEAGPLELELPLYQIAQFLHDAQAPRVKFVAESEIAALREGLTFDQVSWLLGQYRAHLADEYRELVTQPELDQVEKEAEDFSEPDPGP